MDALKKYLKRTFINLIINFHKFSFDFISSKYSLSIIFSAQQRLQHLHYELETTQSQLCKATDELERLAVQSSPDRHLTEDDKQHLRSELAHKISKVVIYLKRFTDIKTATKQF